VCVRLLVDGFGGRDFVEHLLAPLTRPASMCRSTAARWPPVAARHRLRRLHRKIAVIDGRLAFVGGINIISDLDEPASPARASTTRCASKAAGAADPRHRHPRLAAGRLGLVPAAPSAGLRPLPPPRMAASRPASAHLRHRRDIEDAYLTAIAEARSEIILANAFAGRRFRQALLEARRRGVRVTLLTQGWTDHPCSNTPPAPSTASFSPAACGSSNTTAAICTPRWR
jgi:cardiolipin synthase